jgi:NADPH2:quinone reductase
MRASYYEEFGERGVLEFGTMPDPKPTNKELLIQVERSSVNFVDVRERQGNL